jgi:hypothetical protein
MILFDVLRAKESFFSPKIPICGMFIPLDQQECWWRYTFVVNVPSSSGDRFVLATFDTVLGYLLKDPSTLLPSPTFPFTSPSQPYYLLLTSPVVMVATKPSISYPL